MFVKSPHPSDRESYVNFLIDLAKKKNLQGWVVFPNSDDSVYVLSKYKDILEEYYRIPTPSWKVIRNVYIKKNTYQLAEKHGISTPKTYYPENIEALMALNLDYPAVIKPSIRDNFYNKVKIKGFKINNPEELEKTYQYVCSIIDPSEVLVQDFIPGGPSHLYSFCPFFKNGKILASIMGRRSRQHPMDFGHASTFAELVNIPQMKSSAKQFLNLIGYYGIGEVEFIHDPRDDQYKLLELNPRVWGWHTLAIAAGLDYPYLLYQDMIGERMEFPDSLDQMKWVRLSTDTATVFLEIIKGRMKIGDYLKSMKGKKSFAIFTHEDPLPFFAEIAMIPYLWIKRGF